MDSLFPPVLREVYVHPASELGSDEGVLLSKGLSFMEVPVEIDSLAALVQWLKETDGLVVVDLLHPTDGWMRILPGMGQGPLPQTFTLHFRQAGGDAASEDNLKKIVGKALSLHEMLGVHKAKAKGKLPRNFDLQKYQFDYWSRDSYIKLLHQYLQDSLAWMEEAKNDEDTDFDISNDLEKISFHSESADME